MQGTKSAELKECSRLGTGKLQLQRTKQQMSGFEGIQSQRQLLNSLFKSTTAMWDIFMNEKDYVPI